MVSQFGLLCIFFLTCCGFETYFNRFIYTEAKNEVVPIKNGVVWDVIIIYHDVNLLSPSMKWTSLMLCISSVYKVFRIWMSRSHESECKQRLIWGTSPPIFSPCKIDLINFAELQNLCLLNPLYCSRNNQQDRTMIGIALAVQSCSCFMFIACIHE